jgi:hypothetical protein
MTDAELLRACHLSGQMSAEQSVAHFSGQELPVQMYDTEGTQHEQRPSMLTNRWFWASAIVCGIAWGSLGWLFK